MDRFRRRTLAGLHRVQAVASGTKWTRLQLERFQALCLRELLADAYESVPFYRALFDRASLKPADIHTQADLYRIPAVSRSDFQDLPDYKIQAIWAQRQNLVSHSTNGSTSRPLRVRRTRAEDRTLMALRLRVLMNYGARVTDLRASVSMSDLRHQAHQALPGRLGIFPRVVFNYSFAPDRVAQRLRDLHPEIITGFPSSIQRVVECLSPSDRTTIKPRFVTTAAEMLFPEVRAEIADQFQCPVYNLYGSAEANLIAWECPSTGCLHVMDHSVILQVEKQGRAAGPGEVGEVVVTLLHSRAMPFIRYRLGDLAVAGSSPCSCGHGSSTIAALRGRTAEVLAAQNGLEFNAIILGDAVREHVPFVRRFQISQAAVGEVTIRIVCSNVPDAVDLVAAEDRIAIELDRRFRVQLQPVSEISDPTGRKLQYFVPEHRAN